MVHQRDKRDGIGSNVFNFDGLNVKTPVFGLFEAVLAILAIITLIDGVESTEIKFLQVFMRCLHVTYALFVSQTL